MRISTDITQNGQATYALREEMECRYRLGFDNGNAVCHRHPSRSSDSSEPEIDISTRSHHLVAKGVTTCASYGARVDRSSLLRENSADLVGEGWSYRRLGLGYLRSG